VLVLGGGPAGVWAALAAARAGARVALFDKARCGASGPTAKNSVSLWNIPPGPAREEAVARGLADGGHLGDPEWMARVLAETYRRVDQLARWGYRFGGERAGLCQPSPAAGPAWLRSAAASGPDAAGRPARICVDGAHYLTRMRRCLVLAGVRVFDYHPALQLLADAEGVVCGASGVQVRNGFRAWSARADAVVLATGGCAFYSGGAGTDVATGDGLLMAVEAGGELSGMEFSSAYSLVPVCAAPSAAGVRMPGSIPAPELSQHFTTLCDESGAVLGGAGFGSRAAAFEALADGRRVYASWHAERVPLRAVLEGTVRGTGGVRLIGFDCATTVPGLFGAGDVTGREPITGAAGGFGGQGGAWAMSSGVWAGAGAARFARGRGLRGPAWPVPGAGLHTASGIDPRAVIGLVQEHTLPLRRSYWRSAGSLRDSIAELDALWPATAFALGGSGPDRVRAREAAALLAVARWTKYSALARTESRGMHRRTDHPVAVERWCTRLLAGGLDTVWVREDQCALSCTPQGSDLASA